jgi:hypothetical protein
MRQRAKTKVLVKTDPNPSLFLLAAAIMLIALFTVSLARAEPQSGFAVLAAHDDADLADNPLDQAQAFQSDAFPAGEAVIVTRPLQPPLYHDRYRFYHRYDQTQRSRFNPIDDGAR